MAFGRQVNPFFGGPQLGRFQTAGAYTGGAPHVPQMTSPAGRGQALDPVALAALIKEIKAAQQGAGQPGQGRNESYPGGPPIRGVPDINPPSGMGPVSAPAPAGVGAGQQMNPTAALMLHQLQLQQNQGQGQDQGGGGMDPMALLQNPAVINGILSFFA
jgi:hypothetical protein